jgi:hypothetical protein
VTQPGSFPGRPRGRRARPDGDAPEWQGYDATPQEQREFPDLAPVRPPEYRARDGRGQDGPQGPSAPPAGYGAGYPGDSGPGGQRPAGGYGSGQYDSGQYGAGQYGAGRHGAGRPAGGGYPEDGPADPGPEPWAEQPWPGPQPVQQQSAQPWAGQSDPDQPRRYPEPGSPAGQSRTAQQEAPRRARRGKEDNTPSWAEPDSEEAFSERWHRRGLDSRDERREGRRKRRQLLIAGGAVIVLAIAATVYLLSGGPGAAKLGFGSFVTSFLPGELQQVPNPCTTVPKSTLTQYMPGKLSEAAPPLNSGAYTACTWTLDSPPTYRVLEVQLQAYSPSGLASGNGSATFAAEDAYQSLENGFTSPGPKSGQPKATVTDLSGLPGGTETSAFQATQVFDRGGATEDAANVLVRYRNVIVTVVVDGLDQTSGGKTYGPVAMSDLTAEANAVAKEMAAQIAK